MTFIIARNMMLTMYNRWAWVRWKGWVPIFLAIAVFLTWRTWDGPANLLPLIPMSAGTIALWTNNIVKTTLQPLAQPPPQFQSPDHGLHKTRSRCGRSASLHREPRPRP